MHLDQPDLAEFPLAAQVGSVDKFGVGTLLAADLQDAAVLTHRFAKLLSFINGQRHRFFEVNVFAGLAGGDSDDRMLVIRRGDHDRVDIGTRQQLLIIFVQVDLAFFAVIGVVFLHALIEAGAFHVVDVAAGHYFHPVDGNETVEQVHRLLTEADKTDVDRIVGSGFFIFFAFRSSRQPGGHQ